MKFYGVFTSNHPLSHYVVPIEARDKGTAGRFMSEWFNSWSTVYSEETYNHIKQSAQEAGSWNFVELPLQKVPSFYG